MICLLFILMVFEIGELEFMRIVILILRVNLDTYKEQMYICQRVNLAVKG